MATSWFSCKPCSESDPTQHTVKVDPKLFDKENVQPLQSTKQNAEEQRQREIEEEKAARRRREEAAAAAVAEATRKREEAERAAAERAQREAEEAARREAEEAARQEALRLAAEEKAREDEEARAAAAAAALAVQQECARKAEEERAALARKDAEEKVAAWCKTHGFEAMNRQKKTFRGNTKFPLHTAVKYSSQDIIGMMLLAGAQRDVKDSKGQTPLQLAAKLNKNGSHDQIVAMLR